MLNNKKLNPTYLVFWASCISDLLFTFYYHYKFRILTLNCSQQCRLTLHKIISVPSFILFIIPTILFLFLIFFYLFVTFLCYHFCLYKINFVVWHFWGFWQFYQLILAMEKVTFWCEKSTLYYRLLTEFDY